MAHASDTDVLKVKAGDTIEFVATRYEPKAYQDKQWYGCPDGKGMCSDEDPVGQPPNSYMGIQHPGPLLVHISKVPDGKSVHSYDGSGEWIKIHTVGLELRNDDPKHPVWWIPYNGLNPAPRVSDIDTLL